jgi:hypothetical protein
MSGLRRRGGAEDFKEETKDNFKVDTKTIAKNLKKLDLFSKLDVADSRTTNAGGFGEKSCRDCHLCNCCTALSTVSIVTFAIVSILVISEVLAYISSSTREHISVDPSVGQRMSIHFDVTFHALRCKGLSTLQLLNANNDSLMMQMSISMRLISLVSKVMGSSRTFESRESPPLAELLDGRLFTACRCLILPVSWEVQALPYQVVWGGRTAKVTVAHATVLRQSTALVAIIATH